MYRLNSASSKAENVLAKLLLRSSNPMTIVKFEGPNLTILANPETCVIVRRAYVSQIEAFKN
jgi:hypothetical protein